MNQILSPYMQRFFKDVVSMVQQILIRFHLRRVCKNESSIYKCDIKFCTSNLFFVCGLTHICSYIFDNMDLLKYLSPRCLLKLHAINGPTYVVFATHISSD
jgi:hypothetical protein